MSSKSKTKKPTWQDVKQHLNAFDHKAFLNLVQDLYQANKNTQIFLHARFNLGKDNLKPYKEIIERWTYPNVMYNEDYSTSKAKKAISDYEKAVGNPKGMAELSIFYCESCMNFLDCCGLDDEYYLSALVRMLEQSIKHLEQLPAKQQAPFIKRLGEICRQIYKHSYGIDEDVKMIMDEYHLNEKIVSL